MPAPGGKKDAKWLCFTVALARSTWRSNAVAAPVRACHQLIKVAATIGRCNLIARSKKKKKHGRNLNQRNWASSMAAIAPDNMLAPWPSAFFSTNTFLIIYPLSWGSDRLLDKHNCPEMRTGLSAFTTRYLFQGACNLELLWALGAMYNWLYATVYFASTALRWLGLLLIVGEVPQMANVCS